MRNTLARYGVIYLHASMHCLLCW